MCDCNPKGNYDGILVFMIGQSNATDISEALATYLPEPIQLPMVNGFSYYKADYNSSLDDGEIQNFIAGTNDYFGNNGSSGGVNGHYGLHSTLTYRLSTYYNKPVLIVNTAIPGTGMSAWLPTGDPSTSLTDKAIQRMFLPSISKCTFTNPKIIIIDVHGESDSFSLVDSNAYYINKIKQYSYLRADITSGGLGRNIPIIETELRIDGQGTYVSIIRTAQTDLANNLVGVTLFDTSGNDYQLIAGLHYTNDSLINLGNDLSDTIISIL